PAQQVEVSDVEQIERAIGYDRFPALSHMTSFGNDRVRFESTISSYPLKGGPRSAPGLPFRACFRSLYSHELQTFGVVGVASILDFSASSRQARPLRPAT